MTPIDLDSKRKHDVREIVCWSCYYPWTAVAPAEAEKLECPRCKIVNLPMAWRAFDKSGRPISDNADRAAALIREDYAPHASHEVQTAIAEAIRQAVDSASKAK